MEVSLSWALKGAGRSWGKDRGAGGLRGHCSPVCVAEQPGRGGGKERGGFRGTAASRLPLTPYISTLQSQALEPPLQIRADTAPGRPSSRASNTNSRAAIECSWDASTGIARPISLSLRSGGPSHRWLGMLCNTMTELGKGRSRL